MCRNSDRNFIDLQRSGLKYTINSCRPIALSIGLWPLSFQNTLTQKIIKIFLIFASFSFMMFVCMSIILFGIFEANGLAETAAVVGPSSFYVMCIIKYIFILFRGERIAKCFKLVEEDWQRQENEEQLKVMLKNSQFGRSITVVCAIFIYFGGFGNNILSPIMNDPIITHMNISVKPFPCPVHGKFLTSGYSPIYEIVLGSQILAGIVLSSVTIVSFSYVAVLTMHAGGQFDVVILYLNNLLSQFEEGRNIGHEQFVVIIKSHLRVLSFVSQLEALLKEICFIEVLGSTFNLCLAIYSLVKGIKQQNLGVIITFSLLCASFIFNLFVYCYVGEYLTQQARKVGDKGYSIKWYKLPKRTSKDLLFFIRCAQTTPKITAGKIITLSMETFSTVIKTSGAYCNALWNMTK